jgi:hypothetical protein
MSVMTCKNCSQSFEGKFCPACGQAAATHKIDLHYFLHDIPHSVLHIDKGFFYTLKRLSTMPGVMLAEYIDGKRVNHFRPIAFVIIMSTICTIVSNSLRHYILKNDPVNIPFFAKYPSLLIFILIPVISLITWLCFYKRKYNFWEHLLINTYMGAYLNVFLLLVTIIRVIVQLMNIDISMFLTTMAIMFLFMTYYSFAFAAMMYDKDKWTLNALLLCIMDGTIAFVYFTAFAYTGLSKFW